MNREGYKSVNREPNKTSEFLPACATGIQAGVNCELVNSNFISQIHSSPVPNSQVHKFIKPKSAGNEGFKRHNKRKFHKTERMKKLNKK
jgi:hypothetical protein